MPAITRPHCEQRRDEFDRRLDYIDGMARLQSASMLLCGSILGLSGFAFGAFLGFYKQMVEDHHNNYLGEKMHHSYFPATVSEMVYNTKSGAGKCFFGFVMIGGICMLMSWYPWYLRNVYIGDDVLIGSGWFGNDVQGKPRGIRVLMLRQFLPPVGIMMVACIPAPPAANREFTDTVSSIVHTLGAVMSIGGYAFIELYTLLANSSARFDTTRYPMFPEKKVRFILIFCCLVSIGGFQMFAFLAGRAEHFGICCLDEWVVPTVYDFAKLTALGKNDLSKLALKIEDQIAAAHHEKLLKNTASGTFLFFKLGEYWFEVFSGLLMLASHLAIWWYCPERHVDLDEELPDPDGAEGGVYKVLG